MKSLSIRLVSISLAFCFLADPVTAAGIANVSPSFRSSIQANPSYPSREFYIHEAIVPELLIPFRNVAQASLRIAFVALVSRVYLLAQRNPALEWEQRDKGWSWTEIFLFGGGLAALIFGLKIYFSHRHRQARIRTTLLHYFTSEQAQKFRARFGKAGLNVLANPSVELQRFLKLPKIGPVEGFAIWQLYVELKIDEHFFSHIEPILSARGYELNVETLLSRPLLIELVQEAKNNPVEFLDEDTGHIAKIDPFSYSVVSRLTKSRELRDEIPTPDPRVTLRHFLSQLAHEEKMLRVSASGRLPLQVNLMEKWALNPEHAYPAKGFQSNRDVQDYMAKEAQHRQSIVELDQVIREMRKKFKDLKLPEIPSTPTPPFPQKSSTPGRKAAPVDIPTIEAGEALLNFLSSYDDFPSDSEHPILLLVGHDMAESAVGAAFRWAEQVPKPKILIAGGKGGGLLPPGFEAEADFLLEGIRHSGMEIPEGMIVLQKKSNGVYEHVHKSLEEIRRLGLPMDSVIVSQAPMQQLRLRLILETVLHKDIEARRIWIKTILPFYRDFYTAPPEWELDEWRRRLLYEGVREMYMILGAMEQGHIKIKGSDSFPKKVYLEAAIRAGEHIMADDSVPHEKQDDMARYVERIRRYLDPQKGLPNPAQIRQEYLDQKSDAGRRRIMKNLMEWMWDSDDSKRTVARSAASLIVTDNRDIEYMLSEGAEAENVRQMYQSEAVTPEVKEVIRAIVKSVLEKEVPEEGAPAKNIYQSAQWLQSQIEPPVNSSPITMLLPSVLAWPVSAIAYVGRVMQEVAHVLGFWASGVPWKDIHIDLSFQHPETRLLGGRSVQDYPQAVFTGWISNWIFASLLLALIPHAAGLVVVPVVLKIALVSNLAEALLNFLPYTVRVNGRDYHSDLQLISVSA